MGHEQRADDIKNRDARRTSSTSGSIFTFGSMLRTRSWIDRRMLASPGVDLRLEEVSSVAHVSSLGFFNADGVPKNKPQAHISHSPTTNKRERERTCYAACCHATRKCWASRGCGRPRDGTWIRCVQRLADRVRVLRVAAFAEHRCGR